EKTEIVEIKPDYGLKIENYVVSGKPGSGDQSYIFSAPFSQNAIVTGTLPSDKPFYTIKGSVTDPHAGFVQYLTQALKKYQIVVANEKSFKPSKDSLKVIFKHVSPKLSEIVRVTNQRSVNIFAEGLLLALDTTQSTFVSYENAVKTMLGYYHKLGLKTEGVNIYDGSGLSASNSLHSSFVTEALVKISKQPYFDEYFNTLAVAGKSGTLERLCKGTAAENNLRGKSGNINNVTTYCGYVTNKEGKLLAFSFMVNNFSVPNGIMIAKMEKVLVALAE
ncbi:MAG: D-alanyl-D-alanine carboxypeptidase/D-alanyl-D-alanine-endopeptidase, partial [Cytophagales bacterium]